MATRRTRREAAGLPVRAARRHWPRPWRCWPSTATRPGLWPAGRAWSRCSTSGWPLPASWSTSTACPDLDRPRAPTGGTLVVGALTRQRTLELSPEAAGIGALADGLPLVGHVATRNRGTVGGSVAHADPAAELPLALLALGGSVVVEGPGGTPRDPRRPTCSPGSSPPRSNPASSSSRSASPLPVPARPAPCSKWRNATATSRWRRSRFRSGSMRTARVADARIAVGAVADRPLLLPEAAEALVAGAAADEAGRMAAGAGGPGRFAARPRRLPAPPGRRPRRPGRRAGPDRAAAQAGAQSLGHGIVPAFPGQILPRPQREPPASRRRRRAAPSTGGRCRWRACPTGGCCRTSSATTSGLRGTHVGCEHGVCGACTVRVDGVAVRSCLLLARQADGAEIATVEGLAAADEARTLHPLQDAFRRHFALQCGFCTAGILMAAAERLDAVPPDGPGRPPDEDEIRRLLSGHLCRCTGYEPIVAAIAEWPPPHAGGAPREDPGS